MAKSKLADLLRDFPITQMSPRMRASQQNGKAGGFARAAKYSDLQRQQWGEKAGAATFARYGRDYYPAIRWPEKRPRARKVAA